MSRRPKEKIYSNPLWVVAHEAYGWLGGQTILGVCDSYQKAVELIHEVVEQKVLEDYSSFEFLKLKRGYSDVELTEYMAIYKGILKDEICHFSITTVETNLLIKQEELDY